MDQHTTTHIKIPNENLEKLKTHFPHCFDKNGALDGMIRKILEKTWRQLNNVEIFSERDYYGDIIYDIRILLK